MAVCWLHEPAKTTLPVQRLAPGCEAVPVYWLQFSNISQLALSKLPMSLIMLGRGLANLYMDKLRETRQQLTKQ